MMRSPAFPYSDFITSTGSTAAARRFSTPSVGLPRFLPVVSGVHGVPGTTIPYPSPIWTVRSVGGGPNVALVVVWM